MRQVCSHLLYEQHFSQDGRDPEEKIEVICKVNDQYQVVEYSDRTHLQFER